MSEDLDLQQRVIDELELDPSVNAAHIGVSANGGVVTLTGHVESFAEKCAAEQIVRRVRGVKALAQELEVRLPPHKKTADDEIAARAVKILGWDISLSQTTMPSVKVEHGVITLSGEVEYEYQRAAAENDVRRLGGVKAVINNIQIRPRVTVTDVRAKIRAAFERAADLEAGGVVIDVTDGRVTLRGRVHSWPEREAARRAAWSVPGVVAVEDHISVS